MVKNSIPFFYNGLVNPDISRKQGTSKLWK